MQRFGRVEMVGDRIKVRDVFDEHSPLLNPTRPVSGGEGDWISVERNGASAVPGMRLAPAGTARAKIFALAEKHRLDPCFGEQVASTAAAATAGVDDSGLVDRRDLPLVTIDEFTSKDLDQALAIEPIDAGWRVFYALADAAHFAPIHSAVFAEALARGATYYLPGLVVPMLPARFSEDLCSINGNVDRRAMLMQIDVDRQGECIGFEVCRAVVRSRAKLAFQQVQAFLDGAGPAWQDDAVDRSLALLPGVGKARIERANEMGAIRYRRTELDVALTNGNTQFIAMSGLRNDVERFNEQISLLANIQGAKWLRERSEANPGVVQPIYRVHLPPGEQRLGRFSDVLEALIEVHKLDASVWRWNRSKSLASFLEQLPTSGEHGRLARAVHRQAIMTNQRSTFESEPGEHHGVGAEVYGRFTAPMREVVGVFQHAEAWEAQADRSAPLPEGYESAEALREAVVNKANEAKSKQRLLDRETNRMVLDDLLAVGAARGLSRPGTVMGITRGKVHVQLDDPNIDVKVYVPHLEEQLSTELAVLDHDVGMRRVSDGHVVVRLGQRVEVEALERDASRDRWRLALAGLK